MHESDKNSISGLIGFWNMSGNRWGIDEQYTKVTVVKKSFDDVKRYLRKKQI